MASMTKTIEIHPGDAYIVIRDEKGGIKTEASLGNISTCDCMAAVGNTMRQAVDHWPDRSKNHITDALVASFCAGWHRKDANLPSGPEEEHY